MLSFLLITALFLMLLPAMLSVSFASSHPLVILWNFGWYALMGYMAAVALESPVGFLVCFFFCFAYVLKVISTPTQRRHGMRFEQTDFWVNRTFRQRAPGFQRRTPGQARDNQESPRASRQQGAQVNDVTNSDDDVIEAEFTREEPTQN